MGQYGLQVGTPRIQSVGAITFGPGDILFIADNVSATVFAVDVADQGPDAAKRAVRFRQRGHPPGGFSWLRP